MKKRTISKLKSIFGSKKGKKKQHDVHSRSQSPEHHQPVRPDPPSSPPVPVCPIAPVAPEPPGPVTLSSCPVCHRTFVPESLAKHVKICEKMMTKKRKTFDSSRQRREGTDLEQYLPKNFGLPENSPFLEKSPTNTSVVPPKVSQKSGHILPAKNTPHVTRVRKTSPSRQLQRCPHCNRAFGQRAFERHVEWCADKAKILTAASSQPSQHVADAKHRLHARIQYKAPLIRGRRLSQTREKTSRSASVESSQGVSPPPSRDVVDVKPARAKASESLSSNDDTSPHVPVIRNSRMQQSSGDSNAKSRQARLARDLSCNRNTHHPEQNPIGKTNMEEIESKNVIQNKPKSKMKPLKNVEQLKKLEELALNYKNRSQKYKSLQKEKAEKIQKYLKNPVSVIENYNKSCSDEKGPRKDNRESEKTNSSVTEKPINSEMKKSESAKSTKPKVSQHPPNVRKSKLSVHNEKLNKERTMSLDSLDDNIASENVRNCQSIGINTELLCVPCVMHEYGDHKNSAKRKKIVETDQNSDTKSNTSTQTIFKNPTIVSSCESRQGKEYSTLNTNIINVATKVSSDTLTNSYGHNTDNIESSCFTNDDIELTESMDDGEEIEITMSNNDNDPLQDNDKLQDNDPLQNNVEINDEDSLSDTSFADSMEETNHENITVENEDTDAANYRHGSGETYTKFTDNADDLEEFLNITDNMMISPDFTEQTIDLDLDVCLDLHTPNTNSIESMNNVPKLDMLEKKSIKHDFSEAIAELKSNFQDLLSENDVLPVVIEAPKEKLEIQNEIDTNLKLCDVQQTSIQSSNDTKNKEIVQEKLKVADMEHITVYSFDNLLGINKNNLNQTTTQEESQVVTNVIKLPSIIEKKVIDKKRMQHIYNKSNRKYKMLAEDCKNKKDNKTFIVNKKYEENSDNQSISAEEPPLKLPRIDDKKSRLDDNYDPFLSAARQMKELLASETNIHKKLKSNDFKTLPNIRNAKEKSSLSYLRPDNTKTMKDNLNKTYQKTPTLQRMKSFGSTNSDNSNTFGGRCSSFRLNRNENKKSSQKLNTTFTKTSKENISTIDKSPFNRNNSLNRSFSSYTASSYSTPKARDKIPKIATSYHSFQRTTIKQPVKLEKIVKEDNKNNFVNLDSILTDDNSSTLTDSNYIDPRLINENDNLPINVNTILNNPDIISSMESLLTTENLPSKFESFSANNVNNNINGNETKLRPNVLHIQTNNIINNNISNISSAPTADDLSAQYEKIMSSLEQSIASKTSIRDDDSLCEDFDLDEFMTSFDEEVEKQRTESKRTCSSTTRVVKQCELVDSNKSSNCSSPVVKNVSNGLIPFNKSLSFNSSSNNLANESIFPSYIKRSTSLLDSIQKKNTSKTDSGKSRHKTDQLEQDIMQSLKDFDKFYETESKNKETATYNVQIQNGYNTARRNSVVKSEKKSKKSADVSNGNYIPLGKNSDSAYSSLNRVSPSKLSLCNHKESNGVTSLDQKQASSDTSRENDARSISSDEFLAMERSVEMDEPIQKSQDQSYGKEERLDKRVSSRPSSRQTPAPWRPRHDVSSSGSESSLHKHQRDSAPAPAPALTPRPCPRLSRFCHECGSKFPVDTAKFCMECGVKRLYV